METINRVWAHETEAQINNRLQAWLRNANNFVTKHGTDRVRIDIRSAIHDVQRRLSIAFTDFGDDANATYE